MTDLQLLLLESKIKAGIATEDDRADFRNRLIFSSATVLVVRPIPTLAEFLEAHSDLRSVDDPQHRNRCG